MLVAIPEIVWHNKEPIFSIDFHYNSSIYRIATAGADQTIKLWRIVKNGDKTKIVFLASLERHTKSVNTVRFSPDGSLLASAGDDGVVLLWKQNSATNELPSNNMEETESKESWSVVKTMRGHLEDIYDSCWSHDSRYLVTGSVDSSAIVWDVANGEKLSILNDSHHYVQGVAWSKSGCLATLGTDRFLRVYNEKFKCVHSICKRMNEEDKYEKMFQDESMSSFFRRLSFSPDGNILIAPSGLTSVGGDSEPIPECSNVTWVFTLSSLPKPVLYLSACDKPSLAVRFSPILYELHEDCAPLFDLPYRMVFAVATIDTVIIYDTQQTTPIGLIKDIHYTSITDLSWSHDGLILMVSSSDGYCTIVELSHEEMGPVYDCNSPNKSLTTPLTTPLTPSSDSVQSTVSNITPKATRRIIPTRLSPGPQPQPRPTGAPPPRRVNFITLSND